MATASAETPALPAPAASLASIPALRQLGVMLVLALAVALGVTLAMWSQTPNYTVLESDLNAASLAQLTRSLESAGIEYKLANNGRTVLVPDDRLAQARIKAASQGVVLGDGGGYSLLDKDEGLGASSFMQQVRYKRALEGELAKSISRLDIVDSARVHLALPKRSAFIRKHSTPQVSVVLNVQPGRVLDDNQVAGIVNMVASSVPGLEAEHVTVIDQKGRLLSKSGAGEMILTSTQLSYTRRFEEENVKRIVQILSPIVGIDGVRAQVVADIDFTAQEQTRESYLPDQAALRSEQVYEEQDMSGEPGGGVPGALSNKPPEAGTLEPPAQETAAAEATPARSTKRAVRNYELDRTISHTRTSPARLKRLSVAVVVDYKTVVDEEGNSKKAPLDEATIAKITALVKESVGLDESRGDTINIVNAPFQQPEDFEPMPEPPIWQQPWVLSLAKQVAGGLGVLFIIFGVLRPAIRKLTAPLKVEMETVEGEMVAGERDNDIPEAVAAGAVAGGAPGIEGGGAPGVAAGAGGAGGVMGLSTEQQLIELASNMAKEDPKRVAQVMTTWVTEDE